MGNNFCGSSDCVSELVHTVNVPKNVEGNEKVTISDLKVKADDSQFRRCGSKKNKIKISKLTHQTKNIKQQRGHKKSNISLC